MSISIPSSQHRTAMEHHSFQTYSKLFFDVLVKLRKEFTANKRMATEMIEIERRPACPRLEPLEKPKMATMLVPRTKQRILDNCHSFSHFISMKPEVEITLHYRPPSRYLQVPAMDYEFNFTCGFSVYEKLVTLARGKNINCRIPILKQSDIILVLSRHLTWV